MNATLLDADMLSEVLKRKNSQILSHARRYLAAHSRLAFSNMTIYEIVRGLKATGATLSFCGAGVPSWKQIIFTWIDPTLWPFVCSETASDSYSPVSRFCVKTGKTVFGWFQQTFCDQRSEGSTLMSWIRIQQIGGVLFLAGTVVGCGGGSTDAPVAAASSANEPISSAAVANVAPVNEVQSAGITAAIESPAKISDSVASSSIAADDKAAPKSQFPDDEATKTLREILQLQIAPFPADLQQVKTARYDRNVRIVDMSTRVLRLTMDDESRKPQFHQAISQLLEARFQMALSGAQDDIDTFYADVQALNERDPKSVAAAEGVYKIARFAHTKAGQLGKTQPVWFETLSRWAREFADRFPEQQQRAVGLLFGAARSCELHSDATPDVELAKRLATEATLCYTALAEKFAITEQGQEATAALRRMSLVGKTLSQFSGPTAEGGFVSADEFAGKPTLIYFWESDSEEFTEELLPVLQKLRTQLSSDRLRMVGVALDEDESVLNSFMETHSVPGQQIFFPNVDQRSWNSPLIRFWGIAKSPAVWVLDADGKVVSTKANAGDVVKHLQKVVSKSTEAK